ncbi:MAG: hypothetical protein U9Q68_10300, partial [Euryarchaeota archaeon]|nr:hypothetical protein [Euryarchaeota archaeon]
GLLSHPPASHQPVTSDGCGVVQRWWLAFPQTGFASAGEYEFISALSSIRDPEHLTTRYRNNIIHLQMLALANYQRADFFSKDWCFLPIDGSTEERRTFNMPGSINII